MAAAFDQISVYRFDAQLKQIGPRVWKVDGEPLAPVYVVPGSGDILALMKPAAGTVLRLERWTSEGKPVSRRTVDIADVVASQLAPDGSALTVVTSSEIVTIPVGARPTPALEHRRPLPEVVEGSKQVSVAAGSAWFEAGSKLIKVDLEGRPSDGLELPLEKARPRPESLRRPNCPPGPGDGPWQFVGDRKLVALADGGCVVIEIVEHFFRVEGEWICDIVSVPMLSSVSPEGKLRGRISLGQVETKSEWFWSEHSPSNPSWLPERMGLRRTRHRGGDEILGIGPKGSSDLLILTSSQKILRLDATLKKVWSSGLEEWAATEISPSWTRGIAYGRDGRLYVLGENGKGTRWGDYFDVAAMTRPPRVAIQVAVGQTPAGEWLIVNY